MLTTLSYWLVPVTGVALVFCSLVKMVYRMAEEARREPRWFEVEHAIRRNFGGLDELDPVKIFKKHFSSLGSRLEAVCSRSS